MLYVYVCVCCVQSTDCRDAMQPFDGGGKRMLQPAAAVPGRPAATDCAYRTFHVHIMKTFFAFSRRQIIITLYTHCVCVQCVPKIPRGH